MGDEEVSETLGDNSHQKKAREREKIPAGIRQQIRPRSLDDQRRRHTRTAMSRRLAEDLEKCRSFPISSTSAR